MNKGKGDIHTNITINRDEFDFVLVLKLRLMDSIPSEHAFWGLGGSNRIVLIMFHKSY
jgi:hypothetical protein